MSKDWQKMAGGVTLACAMALAGCAAIPGGEPPAVNVADMRMGTAGIFEQQFFVKLRVQNPGERELVLKGVSFDLDLNDKAFARGTSATDAVVPPFGAALVEVETVSTLPGMLRQLSGMTSAGKSPAAMNYRIRGRLHTAGRGAAIPFEEKGEWSLGDAGSGGGR